MDISILKEYGIDAEKGITRCLNDEELYLSVLSLFLSDTTLERGKAALAAEDYTTLFACMHELKGACGNVELTELFGTVCPLVELLRHYDGRDDEIAEAFAAMERAYLRACEGIRAALGE